ncbi:hypothetical protein B9N43_05860 [Denitratisoma sp. DHT3]|uniref:TonB-dependent receptor n=1 Tax=Denitratisoma sp. DHT3 TaxID=1981880 RepID=UPI0011984A29|nr:TonB-dependent receptor [Denitratisoma sp. DHT3]QDX80809.1 hypothetical protein B9N43_05860 [Denitratisoma sp. DHT3]
MHMTGNTLVCKARRTPLYLALAGIMVAGAATTAQGAEKTQLEEVIVTAQKRAENLQEVPISLQVVSASMLEKNAVVSLLDMKDMVPGMVIRRYPGQEDTMYPSIRGILPNQAVISVPTPLVVQIDGVAAASLTGLNTAASDIERIEILKGPQGVMAGRNATGGAINITTAKPDLNDFMFRQQLTWAQWGKFFSKTVVNVPFSDTFAAKIAYVNSSQDRDPSGVRNSAPGGYKFGERDSETWRLDLRWKPTNNLTVDYGYENATTKALPTQLQCIYPWPALSYYSVANPATECGTSYKSALYAPYALPKTDIKADSHTLNLEWTVSPTMTLRSITGYRKLDAAENVQRGAGVDAIGYYAASFPLNILIVPGISPAGVTSTPFNGGVNLSRTDQKAWSQEFQLLGEASKNLKYVAGLYFSEDKGKQNVGITASWYVPNVSNSGTDLILASGNDFTVKNTSKAVFGQISWRPDMFDNKLEIVPGIRYTRDHREATANNQIGPFYSIMDIPFVGNNVLVNVLPAIIDARNMSGSHSFSNTSPSLAFNYFFAQDLMGYLKYSRAYTTGGFDPMADGQANFSRGFEPEKVKSIELGMKAEFLDRRLRTNVAVFQTKFTNEQKTVPMPTAPGMAPNWMVQNAGGSEYHGIDLDITAALTNNLRVSFDASTLHHKYTSYEIAGVDYAYETRSIVPKLSYSASLDYRFPSMGLPGQLSGNLSVTHQDKSSTPFTSSKVAETIGGPFDPTSMTSPGYTLWNGRLALSHIKVGPGGKGDLTVAVWGKNLADKKYMSFLSMNAISFASNWGPRRTIGLDVIYQY